MRNAIIRLITVTLLCSSATTVAAQVITENNARRVAAAAPTKEQLKQQKALVKKARAEAKKKVKTMQAEGWKPAPGTLDLVTQFTNLNVIEAQKSAYNMPVQYCASTTAIARSYGMARKHATARCKSEIAQSIATQVAGLISLVEENVELTSDQAKFVETAKQHYDADLGHTDYIVEAIREKDENVEAYIAIAVDVPEMLHSIVGKIAEQSPDAAEKVGSFFDN